MALLESIGCCIGEIAEDLLLGWPSWYLGSSCILGYINVWEDREGSLTLSMKNSDHLGAEATSRLRWRPLHIQHKFVIHDLNPRKRHAAERKK